MTRSNPERCWDWTLVQGFKYTHKRHLCVEQLLSEELNRNKNDHFNNNQ